MPASAAAQGFDAERFVPAAGAASELSVESPVVPYHLGLGLGLFFNFADNPVVEVDTGTGEELSKPLDHSLSADLIASIGLWDFFELGLHLPVHLIQDGDDYAVGGATLRGAAGIGDLRVVPKFTLWAPGDFDNHLVAANRSAFKITRLWPLTLETETDGKEQQRVHNPPFSVGHHGASPS